MSYTPKSEEQLAKEGLLPDGEYDFTVIETSEGVSKKGNEMWILKQHFFALDGSGRLITTWLTFGNNYGERMLRHAADSCGILEIYTSGNMKSTDFLNKSGRAVLTQRQDDKMTWWNSVKDYVVRIPGNISGSQPVKTAADLDDEIPF